MMVATGLVVPHCWWTSITQHSFPVGTHTSGTSAVCGWHSENDVLDDWRKLQDTSSDTLCRLYALR